MNETVVKYLEALDRTNNNEMAFTYEEQAEFDAFFKEHPDLEQMRKELLEQEVPEYRQKIADRYLSDIAKNKNIEGQLNDIGFNMKSFRDVTLDNDKRIIVFFAKGSNEPITIEYDPYSNILDDLRQRQLDYGQYQSLDAGFNAEEMLKDLAKEKNLYIKTKLIENYEPDSKYINDPDKMKIISSLLKQASEKNATLQPDEKFAYIDEENNYIMSKTGVVLEAKLDTLKDEVTVESPENEREFNDELINDENVDTAKQTAAGNNEKEIKDEDHSTEEINKEEEEKDKYEIAVDKILDEKGYSVTDEQKQKIIENTKMLDEGTITLDDVPETQRDFYEKSLEESQNTVINEQELSGNVHINDNKGYELENTYTKKLIYKPKKDSSSGSSNYLYIALVVLIIAFAIFMYIIFRG